MSLGQPLLRSVPLVFVLALLVLQGCRRKSAAPPAPPAAEASVTAPATSATGSPPAVTAPSAKPASEPRDELPTAPNDASLRYPVHKELTGAVHLYLNDYQKLPASFDVLVKGKYLKTMPKPPPGKHFALDRNRTQVVILD